MRRLTTPTTSERERPNRTRQRERQRRAPRERARGGAYVYSICKDGVAILTRGHHPSYNSRPDTVKREVARCCGSWPGDWGNRNKAPLRPRREGTHILSLSFSPTPRYTTLSDPLPISLNALLPLEPSP